jgi:hypothetical protein
MLARQRAQLTASAKTSSPHEGQVILDISSSGVPLGMRRVIECIGTVESWGPY